VDRLYGANVPELWRLWTDSTLAKRLGLRLMFEADDGSVRVFGRGLNTG